MPAFAAFTVLEYRSDEVKGSVGTPYFTNHRYELISRVRFVNMDRVLRIENYNHAAGVPTSDLIIDTDSPDNTVMVPREELEAWLSDNPQFGGRSTLHLIKQGEEA